MKGSGGAFGLTKKSVAFNKWMVAGPEQVRLVLEFEGNVDEALAKYKAHGAGLAYNNNNFVFSQALLLQHVRRAVYQSGLWC